jgi:hypothetical protein
VAQRPNRAGTPVSGRRIGNFDLGSLLHPARAFAHPMDVLEDADLTLNEKRVLLSSWASTWAAEASSGSAPSCGGAPVQFGDIVEALRALDRAAGACKRPPHYRHVLANRRPGTSVRRSRRRLGDGGSSTDQT